jgi:hypothetical protein
MSETQEKTKNCTACKIRDEKILDLQRQVITLETSKDQPTQMSCKECAVKDKQLFLLEQNRVKIQSEVEHKDRLISTLCSDLQSKEAMMKTYNELVRTNSILDKQIIGKYKIVSNAISFGFSLNCHRKYRTDSECIALSITLTKFVLLGMHIHLVPSARNYMSNIMLYVEIKS